MYSNLAGTCTVREMHFSRGSGGIAAPLPPRKILKNKCYKIEFGALITVMKYHKQQNFRGEKTFAIFADFVYTEKVFPTKGLDSMVL